MAQQDVYIGDNGSQLVSKLKNNFDELYLGTGGIGYTIQPGDDISDTSWWTDKSATYSTFSIIHDFDFGGNAIMLPSDITLLFSGGVWSNGTIIGSDTIFCVYGNKQSFETDLLLTGTWKTDLIMPQYYGATSNPNNTTYSNSSTNALQACLDSLFNIYFPSGFYYLDSPVYVTKPKTIYCHGDRIYSGVFTYSLDTTVLYSDLDIDFITIQSGNVSWKGGCIDLSKIAAHTHSAVRYDCSYNISKGEVTISVFGNQTALISGLNTGNGVLFDTVNATANAETHFININLYIYYVKYGLWVQGLNIAFPNIFIADLVVNEVAWGTKQMVRLEMGGRSYVKCVCQDAKVLSVPEHDMPMIYVDSNFININPVFYDYDELRTEVIPPFSHRNIIENNGYSNMIEGTNGLVQLSNPQYKLSIIQNESLNDDQIIKPYSSFSFINDKGFYWKRNFISHFDNVLLNLNLRSLTPPTVKKYDSVALGVDFDTDLNETVGVETANVTITDEYGMFSSRRLATTVVFTNAATKDTDYIEVVINENIELLWFLAAWNTIFSVFNRIQLIITESGTGIQTVINEYPIFHTGYGYKPYVIDFGTSFSLTVSKIIIRFIGINSINQNLWISELIALESIGGLSSGFSNVIDSGGGQTIYGTLALTDALIQTELSGALTDGAPTDAEIDSITGTTPAAAGAGWKCTIKDTSGTGLIYLVESDGTDWFYTVMTKAV